MQKTVYFFALACYNKATNKQGGRQVKRFYSFVLALIFVFCVCAQTLTVFATDTPTTVTITFTGDEAEKAGFMQSTISIVPGDGAALDGYYLIYYTDGSKTLSNYDELASVAVADGSTVSVNIKDGIMIPPEAKGIAVFESRTRFVDNAPDIKNAVAKASIPTSKRLTLGTPEASFGAASDVHMNYEQHNRGAYQKWANALEFFAEEGMEQVIVAGDMTGDRGETPDLEAQYAKYVEIVNKSDISLSSIYECIGNHGNTSADRPIFNEYLTGSDEVHPYNGSPYYHVLKKGKTRDNLFIFMCQEIEATGESSTKDNFSKAQIDWLAGLLAQYGKTKTNIFLVIHSPFLNYGAGDRKNGGYTALITFKEEYTQTMRLKGLLETYKDIIVMSGHTHVSLYDNVNYSDEYNSFARTVHIGSTAQPCAYGGSATYTRNTDGRYEVSTTYGSEAYTVKIYSDYIVYTGYNLATGKIIPAACLLIPVKAYGGAGNPNLPKDPSEVFEGSGTVSDPYLITSPDDFMALTAGFNACNTTIQSEMYGYGKYFLQTADIDMTDYYGYCGTEANGNAKAFFAGVYNGNGHTLTVNINGTNQRSVFPYVYGVVANLHIKGSITTEVSAQPVRTLYGSIINCIFDMDLYSNDRANGLLYSNYGYVYNVYTIGVLKGKNYNDPVSANDTSTTYHNVYHYRKNTSGGLIADAYGMQSSNIAGIVSAFNNTSAAQYATALAKLGGFSIVSVRESNSMLAFEIKASPEPDPETMLGDVNNDGSINQYDYILIKRHYFETRILTSSEMTRADVNRDNNVDQFDYILVARHYFGTYIIK